MMRDLDEQAARLRVELEFGKWQRRRERRAWIIAIVCGLAIVVAIGVCAVWVAS